jgi:hypothetical protein
MPQRPAGAPGDFLGPGTTVGISFAAQLGVKLDFWIDNQTFPAVPSHEKPTLFG